MELMSVLAGKATALISCCQDIILLQVTAKLELNWGKGLLDVHPRITCKINVKTVMYNNIATI